MKPTSGGGDGMDAGTGRKFSPVPDPPITTLKVDILSENSTKYVPCIPNGREPCPFETEFFKGIATIVIRTTPVDDYFESFFRGKRMFEVQVQGKFKREPIGEIYVGAECSIKVDMGMLTKSITKAALKFCGTMVNDLHYSFGDNQSNPNYELPHIVAPIFPTFDKVLVTPPGGVLPEMNIPFNEDLEFRKQRIKYRLTSDAKIDLNTTYSFSVNTSNLNLLTWNLVGIPMVRPMDLRSFVGASSISLVGYEIPHAVLKEFPNAHPRNKLNYVFNMKLTPVEPDSLPVMDFPIGSSDDEVEDNDGDDPAESSHVHPTVMKSMAAQVNTVTAVADDGSSSDEGEGDDGADIRGGGGGLDEDGTADVKSGVSNHRKSGNRISGWFRKHMGGGGKDGGNKDTKEDAADDVLETSDYCSTDYEMESAGDLKYCPACLDLNDYRKDGKRRVLYFMPPLEHVSHGSQQQHQQGSVGATEGSEDAFDPAYPRLRAYSEIAKNLPLAIIPRMYKNKRLSNNEKRRRQVVETYKSIVKNGNPVLMAKLNHFLTQVTEADRTFLNGPAAVIHNRSKTKAQQHSADDTWEGYVALAQSRRHWSEQYIVLSKTELLFYRHSDSRKVILRIPLASVASVQPMRQEEVPLTGFSFFQVETFSRMYYFLVHSDMQLNEWIQAFLTVLGSQILKSPFNLPVHGADESAASQQQQHQSSVFALEIEDELYIAKSACWKLDKKRIFNYRRIIFNPNGVSEKWKNISPNELMENILITAYSISHFEPQKNLELSQQWVKFLDLISLLQTINISVLSEKERIVFFLNLYHVMIIHGNMTIGPPPSWNYWNAFFNHITYLVGYEIISIADVDHNLLRAAMSRPSSLSIIPVPVAHFPGMAITHRDFRLNFCINNGSKSMPSVVPIYKVALLDKQMDEMTSLHLMQSCEVDLQKRIIQLPKVSLHDFAVRKIVNTTSVDCLRCLLPYLKKEDKLNAMKLLSDGSAPVIRFKPASLRCRVFQVLNNKSTAGSKPATTSPASGNDSKSSTSGNVLATSSGVESGISVAND